MLPLPNGIFGRPMRACPPETKWFFATLHRYNEGIETSVCLNPWGEINLEKSGCGGNEQKSVKRGGNG